MMTIVKINEHGAGRVLRGEPGMTFVVDSFTVTGRGNIAHVRDYRFVTKGRDFQIWSIGPEGYEIVATFSFKQVA